MVIDAGANIGNFSAAILDGFESRVIALEPHPKYFEAIPEHDRLLKLCCALGDSDGRRRLQLDANPQAARLVESENGQGTTTDVRRLDTLMREQGLEKLALVKLDIEGTELEVLDSLADSTLDQIAQFTIEFHDFAGYITTDQVEQALARLASRGWTTIRFSHRQYGDTLVINRKLVQLTEAEIWWMRNVSRNVRGVVRRVRRQLGGQA